PDSGRYRQLGPGIAALERADFEAARLGFEQVIQTHPEITDAKYLYCDASLGLQQQETAIEQLYQWVETEPSDPVFWLNIAKIYAENGNRDQAEIAFNQALQNGQNHLPTRVAFCYQLYLWGNYTEGLRLVTQGRIKAPTNSDLLALEGLMLLGLDMVDAAATLFRNIPDEVSLNTPLFDCFLEKLFSSDPRVIELQEIYKVAISLYQEAATVNAINYLKMVLDWSVDPEMLGNAYLLMGNCYHVLENDAEATKNFEAGLKKSPDHHELLLKMIAYHINHDQFTEAKKMLRSALKNRSRSVELLMLLGNCYIEEENYKHAYDIFIQVHGLAPKTTGLIQAINQLAEITGHKKMKVTNVQEGINTMEAKSIYTKDLLQQYITKLGFIIGDYSYGAPIIRWWGEKAKLQIGRYCSIASNVKVYLGGNHHHDWVTTYPFPSDPMNEQWPGVQNLGLPKLPTTNGDVIIGDDVWIGDDVSILSGIVIGPGAVIAAKSMVTKDVPAFAVVGGNPAKVISYRFTEDIIRELMAIKWWNWPAEKVNTYMPLICSNDIAAFIQAARNNSAPETTPESSPTKSVEPLFTGERAMPLAPNMIEPIMIEHWARYKLAGPKVKGKRVLDIACGAGYGSDYLAKYAKTVVGGDIDPETIGYCHEKYKRGNLDYKVMDIRNI
ncbi:MAG TPA: hypothetical protein DHU63_11980, partial [Candidatus Marinimicrobia bacterium]|nr:hypothetical protein [Candidatus Neomarinimicrobiota bacterium]